MIKKEKLNIELQKIINFIEEEKLKSSYNSDFMKELHSLNKQFLLLNSNINDYYSERILNFIKYVENINIEGLVEYDKEGVLLYV